MPSPRLIAATIILSVCAAAQSFDAASIKAAAVRLGAEGGNRSRIEHTPTSLSMFNVDLGACVQWAYGVARFQVAAAHLPSDSYDILAKTAGPVDVSQLRLMLQNLLAKRFQLGLHRETRMLPVYELVVAKGGPKLPPPLGADPVHAAESLPRIRNGSFVFAGVTLPEFAQMLMQLSGVDLPVIDRTGIAGAYDIVLKSAPEAARNSDTTALFAIIQDQLGLKLSAAKAPIDVVVIDRSEKPLAN